MGQSTLTAPSDTLARPRVSAGSTLRVLLAVARKEWIIFTRYPTWVIAIIVWPVIFPLGYIFTAKALGGPNGASLHAFERLAGTSDYISYIVMGTVMWMWLNMTLWDIGFHLREEQMRGTLESNWLCPVPRLLMMMGASLAKLSTSFIFLILTVIEFRLVFGVSLVRGNVPLLLAVVLLTMPSIYGIGVMFASLVIRFREANAMVFLVRGLVSVFCGITYPLAVLPVWMHGVAQFIPITYAIRDTRAAALSNASFAQVAPDLAKLGAFAVVLPVLGCLAFAYTERRARRTGSLAQY